ncbi:MAG: hypothetical protein JWR77_2352 [Rhizorhabdus sp.]|nr:hypothetical protein [Rhizorhabdus sp.]
MTEYRFAAGEPVLLPLSMAGTTISLSIGADGATTVTPDEEDVEARIAEIQERLGNPADELHYVSLGDVEWLIERVRELAGYDSTPPS